MAYEYERDEWRSAVRALSETDRLITVDETRRALGIIGDPTDDYQPDNTTDEDEGEL